jgi:hypothetical protein
MIRRSIALSVVGALALVIAGLAPAQHAAAPAVTYGSFMKTKFFPNGSLMLSEYDMAFVPPAPVNAQIAVVDSEGKTVGAWRFYPDHRMSHGVFARLQVEGTPQVQLTEPGVYGIVVLVDGQPVSRFPFALAEGPGGGDEFNPTSTFRVRGLWERLAYFSYETYKGQTVPKLNLWLGGADLSDANAFQEKFMVALRRGDEVIAHSKRRTNSFGTGHYKRHDTLLFEPHEERDEPNAVPVTTEMLARDGKYDVVVLRGADEALIRRFEFEVADGSMVPLPKTESSYTPRLDYMVPRRPKPSSSTYEFEEISWISAAE